MRSEAKTVEGYLAELPEDRREAISAYPETYNKQPLMYAALASQKNHMAVYLSGIYTEQGRRADFEKAYKATGKRYDVGQSCVRFTALEHLPLEVIGEATASLSMNAFIAQYEVARGIDKRKNCATAPEPLPGSKPPV